MNEEFVQNRISQLRVSKGVSEYQLSRDLGHSKSYIHNITSGKSLPSMSEFLYMCDYFGITPQQFFDDGTTNPILIQKALDGMKDLPDRDLLTLIAVIDRFNEKK